MLPMFWICAAACLVAEVFIVRAAARTVPTGGAGDGDPDRPALPHVHRASEVAWALVPAIALAVLLAFTWRAIAHLAATHGATTAVQLTSAAR